MIVIVGLLFAGAILLGTLLMLRLRRLVFDEGRLEDRLRQPGTHKLAYLVPNGQDPVGLMAALANAHFTSVADEDGGTERLLVACDEQDREQVRRVIEHVDHAGFDGSVLHGGHVRFEDEPETAQT